MKLLHRASGWAILAAAWLAFASAPRALAQEKGREEFDWERVLDLKMRPVRGERLTAEEKDYLERGWAAKAKEGRPAGPARRINTSTGRVPLDQMTAEDRYKEQDGGLYGGGRNIPPDDHLRAALAESAKIRPLDPEGNPAFDGKIDLLAIGMTNVNHEFGSFKRAADRDRAKASAVVIVNGGNPGFDATGWSSAEGEVWPWAEQRLREDGVTAKQVQAVWMKHALLSPDKYGDFPEHADTLKGLILASLNTAREFYPNLRLAFLSSRAFGGYARLPLNTEPYAYESAFAVRGLIRDQMKGGEAKLNWDAAKGPVKAPLLLWGPYLWADGATPRRRDGLVWKREDFGADGSRTSALGREKAAGLLIAFFKANPCAKGWFLRQGN
ncbi:MAG: hypothetical protein FJ291_23245 [Planctomycetes bacterium]|nr:hypothetical protein [Planctomycetota bacterium]